MPSAALTSLKTLIDQLVAQRDALQQRLEKLDESLDDLRKGYNVLTALEQHEPLGKVSGESRVRETLQLKRPRKPITINVSKNPDKRDVAAAAAAILMESAAPMSRTEIFNKLKEQGIEIHGKDAEMVLSTMLWRAGEEFGIENEKGKGYILRGKDYGVFG